MFETLNSVLQAYKLKPIKEAPAELESDESKPCIVFFTLAEDNVPLSSLVASFLGKPAFMIQMGMERLS